MCYNPFLTFILMLKLSQILLRALSNWLPCPLTHPHCFLSSSYILPQPDVPGCLRTSHFPKEPWLPLVESDRNQDLGSGVLLASGVSLFLGPFNAQS